MDLENIKTVVIDDSELSLSMIGELAKGIGLDVTAFLNPLEALEYIRENRVDMVLTDFVMPQMDGITLIKEVRAICEDVPIIMITAAGNNQALKNEALLSGATDFLSKPFDEVELRARTANLALLRQSQQELKARDEYLELEIDRAVLEMGRRERETLQVIGRIAEMRDSESGNHTSRVGHYARLIARGLGMDDKDCELVFYSSQLHDVGKIGVSDNILLKPGKLTTVEFEIVKNHTTLGYDILKDSESLFLKVAAIIAVSHHEKFNGSGYPYQLAENDIPLWGRIVAVADVFDVLTSRRPYKEPWSLEEAVGMLEEGKGVHFDPEIIDAFLKARDEVDKIHSDMSDNF